MPCLYNSFRTDRDIIDSCLYISSPLTSHHGTIPSIPKAASFPLSDNTIILNFAPCAQWQGCEFFVKIFGC